MDHLVVEVGARGDARIARFGDDLPAGDPFARLHEDFAQVRVAGLVAKFVVQQHHAPVSAVAPRGGDLHHGVARGVDRRAAVAAQVDALVGADIPQHGVHAPHVEGADMVVVQRRAVDGPYGRDRRRHLLLVAGECLQFVERHRFEVEYAGQRIELFPGADHQRGEVVPGHRGVFGVGIRLPHAVEGHRVGREERAVDVVVAVADFVHAPLRGADAVLQDAVLDHQVAVVADDAVHLGGVEEVREEHVGDRDENEADEYLADQTVGAQAERGGDHVARQCLRLVRQRVCIRSLPFLPHRGKNSC